MPHNTLPLQVPLELNLVSHKRMYNYKKPYAQKVFARCCVCEACGWWVDCLLAWVRARARACVGGMGTWVALTPESVEGLMVCNQVRTAAARPSMHAAWTCCCFPVSPLQAVASVAAHVTQPLSHTLSHRCTHAARCGACAMMLCGARAPSSNKHTLLVAAAAPCLQR